MSNTGEPLNSNNDNNNNCTTSECKITYDFY